MSASVLALREIFQDPTVSIRRRLEAAEQVLLFESPTTVAQAAKAFLVEIFEDTDYPVDQRLDALRIMRKAESPRVTQPPVSPAEAHRSREIWRSRAIAERQQELIDNDLWPAPADWCADLLSPDWEPPEGSPPGSRPIDFAGMAEIIRRGRLAADEKLKREREGG